MTKYPREIKVFHLTQVKKEKEIAKATPKTEWLTKARLHAKIGLGVWLAKKPFPRHGIKKIHGMATLIAPKIKPSRIVLDKMWKYSTKNQKLIAYINATT